MQSFTCEQEVGLAVVVRGRKLQGTTRGTGQGRGSWLGGGGFSRILLEVIQKTWEK